MKQLFYGEIDLDSLFTVAKQQQQLVNTYQDKNGYTHHTIRVAILQRDQPDKGGNTHSIKVQVKQDDVQEALKYKYWVGSLKESTPRDTQPQSGWNPNDNPFGNDNQNDDLPF